MGDSLRWMTQFSMKVIDIFLFRNSNWLPPLVTCFLEKLDSGYLAIVSLDSAISDDISQSKDLTTLLFQWSLEIFFPCKSSHVMENRFSPALGQNCMGHYVWTLLVLTTCWMLMQSFPSSLLACFQSFLESTHWNWWCWIDWYHYSWCDKLHWSLWSCVLCEQKICPHQW